MNLNLKYVFPLVIGAFCFGYFMDNGNEKIQNQKQVDSHSVETQKVHTQNTIQTQNTKIKQDFLDKKSLAIHSKTRFIPSYKFKNETSVNKQIDKAQKYAQKREAESRVRFAQKQKQYEALKRRAAMKDSYMQMQKMLAQKNPQNIKITSKTMQKDAMQSYVSRLNYLKRQQEIQRQMTLQERYKKN